MATCALYTFPLAEVVLLPSRSSEKSVSEENRVSVSLVHKYQNENSYKISSYRKCKIEKKHLLSKGEL